MRRCWGLRDYISLSPGKLNDALAVLAFRHRDQIVERTRQIVAENLPFAARWFAENADLVSWTPPRGGILALMKYQLDLPSLELANRLAEDYSVMLAPGSAFGYEGYLRIGVGNAPAIFAEGLRQTAPASGICQRSRRAAASRRWQRHQPDGGSQPNPSPVEDRRGLSCRPGQLISPFEGRRAGARG